jgi:hypothetical protein
LIICSALPNGMDGELLGLKRVSWPPVSKRNGNGNGKGKGSNSAGSSRGGRVNDNKGGLLTVRSNVKFPEGILADSTSNNTARVNIRVISDSYVGMAWAVSNIEVNLDTGIETIETQTLEESSVPTKD